MHPSSASSMVAGAAGTSERWFSRLMACSSSLQQRQEGCGGAQGCGCCTMGYFLSNVQNWQRQWRGFSHKPEGLKGVRNRHWGGVGW